MNGPQGAISPCGSGLATPPAANRALRTPPPPDSTGRRGYGSGASWDRSRRPGATEPKVKLVKVPWSNPLARKDFDGAGMAAKVAQKEPSPPPGDR